MPAVTLQRCPSPLPDDMEAAVRALAVLWAAHPSRPQIAAAALLHWDALISDWANEPTMPLLVRKSQRGVARGEVVMHRSGRELVLTDNSPASWSYVNAHAQQLLSLNDVKAALAADRIPVTMVVDRATAERGRYRCSKASSPTPNKLGWKVCHTRAIGMNGRKRLEDRDIAALKSHFKDFVSPSNMFLVPLHLGGLGEVPQVLEAITGSNGGI